MSAIIEYLRTFNRKERFFLVGTALGNPAFRFDSAFSERLGGTFALEVPADVFVAMDYHLDWIYARAYLSHEGLGLLIERLARVKIDLPMHRVHQLFKLVVAPEVLSADRGD